MPPIQYFAYGSNMFRVRLLARKVVLLDQGQPGVVEGYKLLFNKASIDGSSKANLVPASGQKAWGVLFTVDPTTLDHLDTAEGAPDHYRREYGLQVNTQSGQFQAMTYLAQPDKILTTPDQPYDWYLALILAGSIACPGFPRKWLAHLRQIAQPKPDLKQSRKTFVEAVAQLKAAGHEKWQDLLTDSSTPCPPVTICG